MHKYTSLVEGFGPRQTSKVGNKAKLYPHKSLKHTLFQICVKIKGTDTDWEGAYKVANTPGNERCKLLMLTLRSCW